MTEALVVLITGLTQEMLEADGAPSADLGPDTDLFTKGGLLDSMGIVSLIVAIEQAIEDEYGASIALADERALSQTAGPYRTIRTLAEYATSVLEASK